MGKGRRLISLLNLAVLVLALAIMLLIPQATVQAKEPFNFPVSDNATSITLPTAGCPGGIAIDNGIININYFGERGECCYGFWLYPGGYSNCYQEIPFMSFDSKLPMPLSVGTVTQCYPLTGNPDKWYEAIINLDLDGGAPDVEVHREIMVPSGESYFLAKYSIKNIKGIAMPNFRFFQGVDYDVASSTNDEGGYDGNDFVWEHDLSGVGTYVGFKGNSQSAHHDVAYYGNMWTDVASGNLNDADYYKGDTGVALEWDLGTMPAGASTTFTVTFAFAPTFDDLSTIVLGLEPGILVSQPKPSPSFQTPTPQRLNQAILSTSYARVTPQQTYANQPVTISTNVVNSGGETGNYNVVLRINGQMEQSKMVSVGPGGAYPVKFTVTKSQPGTYTATIDGHQTDFIILGDKTSRTSASGGLIPVVIAGIIILVIASVLILSFRRPA